MSTAIPCTMSLPRAPIPAADWPAIGRPAWSTARGAGCGILALVIGLLLHEAWQSMTDAAAAPVQASATAPARAAALVSTGVVETIRELPDADNGARSFEMTIRMRDGTLRTSTETGDARWRAGDKVSLLGGPDSR